MEEQKMITEKLNGKKEIKIKPLSKSGICKNKNCKGCKHLQKKISISENKNLVLEEEEFNELLNELKSYLCPSVFEDLNL